MKLHYMGKYSLDPETLPYKEHEPGAVMFKEAKDSKTLGLIASILSLVIVIPFLAGFLLRWGFDLLDLRAMTGYCIGAILTIIAMFPHELLHAVCFKEDVYLYTNLKQGMLFVAGPERMGKLRFVVLSLLPNIVLGFVPYIISMFVFSPVLGIFGAVMISGGAGDYYNVWNCLTQVPKGGRVYMHKFNTFWYLP